MAAIVSWNIQYGCGCDGVIDLERTAAGIRAMGDADVICLQEVSRFDTTFDGNDAPDQVARLSELLPGYEAFFGPAINRIGGRDGRRLEFGNLVLTRLPALQVFMHALPQLADGAEKYMPRQATEIVVETPAGAMRIVTTHLEYFATNHRSAQIAQLRRIYADAGNATDPAAFDPPGTIFAKVSRPEPFLLCGDFNMQTTEDDYQVMTAPVDGAPDGLVDAWRVLNGERDHPPTCGIHDQVQWPDGPHTRDFCFVSRSVAPRVRALTVDTETDASDHQPFRIELAD